MEFNNIKSLFMGVRANGTGKDTFKCLCPAYIDKNNSFDCCWLIVFLLFQSFQYCWQRSRIRAVANFGAQNYQPSTYFERSTKLVLTTEPPLLGRYC